MTDQEILALTDDDLKRMIQLKMLEEGIKILARPDEPQYAEVPAKDLSAFRVKIGYSHDAILYADRNAAERVAQAIRAETALLRRQEYVSGPAYEQTLAPYDAEPELTIEELRFYSRNVYDQARGALEGNKKLKDAYENQLQEYRETQEAAAWIRNEVNDRHYEVVTKHRRLEEMLAKFNEYLQLADNDHEKATVFFDKAYYPDEETRDYLAEKTGNLYLLAFAEAVEPVVVETPKRTRR